MPRHVTAARLLTGDSAVLAPSTEAGSQPAKSTDRQPALPHADTTTLLPESEGPAFMPGL